MDNLRDLVRRGIVRNLIIFDADKKGIPKLIWEMESVMHIDRLYIPSDLFIDYLDPNQPIPSEPKCFHVTLLRNPELNYNSEIIHFYFSELKGMLPANCTRLCIGIKDETNEVLLGAV